MTPYFSRPRENPELKTKEKVAFKCTYLPHLASSETLFTQ